MKEERLPEGRFVVLKFPDTEAAEAFYNEPDYQPIKPVSRP